MFKGRTSAIELACNRGFQNELMSMEAVSARADVSTATITRTESLLNVNDPKTTPTRSFLPEGLPGWITTEAIEDALRTWQPYYATELTRDDAVAILITAGNLFTALEGISRETTKIEKPEQSDAA
jgi:hypothetical protein